MIAVTLPTSDVNSESVELVTWHVEDRSPLVAGQLLAEVETSKAVLDVSAPADGFVLHCVSVGERVPITEALAYVFADLSELERHVAQAPAPEAPDQSVRVSAPARRRAHELGVDVEELLATHGGLITVGIVEAAADSAPRGPLPDPLPVQSGVRRIVLIGAGLGATQVQEIIRSDPTRKAVAIVDDAQKTWGEVVGGVPVIGPPDRMLELHRDGALDGAIIAVGTSVAARARLRKLCDEARLPLESAIDPSARIAAAAQIGAGNVICALCHVGTGTVLGENNFISAYNSFDHHNVIGSDIATGPGCMTSGLVKIGDRCRLGTGVFIEPHVELGAEVTVASGAIIVGSVPARHSVKRRLLTTTVVPRRDL